MYWNGLSESSKVPESMPTTSLNFLFNLDARQYVKDEDRARAYLEAYYRALVESSGRWPGIDFNDFMTVFLHTKELVLLPAITGKSHDELVRTVREEVERLMDESFYILIAGPNLRDWLLEGSKHNKVFVANTHLDRGCYRAAIMILKE